MVLTSRTTPLPAFAAMAALALSACVSIPDTRDFGQERLDDCIAESCATLRLDGQGLRDYGQLAALSHVTSLMVSHTDLDSLAPVAGMTQLQELHVGYPQIADFGALEGLGNLRLLHMQGASPAQLATLRAPASLRELAIGHGEMTDLSIMETLPQVQRLHVATFGGGLDLAALEGHGGLRSLHLTTLRGVDLTPLLGARTLRELSFTGILADLDPVQTSVLAQLRARGVRVTAELPVVVVC